MLHYFTLTVYRNRPLIQTGIEIKLFIYVTFQLDNEKIASSAKMQTVILYHNFETAQHRQTALLEQFCDLMHGFKTPGVVIIYCPKLHCIYYCCNTCCIHIKYRGWQETPPGNHVIQNYT